MAEKSNKLKDYINKYYKQYYMPTPTNIRKWADGLLACSTFVTASSIIENYPLLALIALFVGVLGKFVSNFFSENK